MKKSKMQFKGILLLLALIIPACSLAQTRPDTVDFKNEVQISVNSQPYVLKKNKVRKHRHLYKRCVKLNTQKKHFGKELKLQTYQVVNTLYAEAEDLRIQSGEKDCITGVWIYFGYKDGQLQYLFQPAVFTHRDKTTKMLKFDLVKTGHLYEYDGSNFVLSDGELEHESVAYFKAMQVKRKGWLSRYAPGRFRNETGAPIQTSDGDVTNLFYSFQEILRFYSSMNPDEIVRHSCYEKNIYINSSASKFKTESSKHQVKHTTYIKAQISDSKTSEKMLVTSYSSTAADLAHLCPTNCQNVSYPTASAAVALMRR